jgi:hypothetical protein
VRAFAAQLEQRAQAACTEQAQRLAQDAADGAPSGSTGDLANSVYWYTATGETNYAEKKDALSTRTKARAFGAPQIPTAPAAGAAVMARQGMPINNGFTHARDTNLHIAAKPFWTRALERNKRAFQATVRRHMQGQGGTDGG